MKIVSRYLEQTLTRDDVRRDKHFSRALELATHARRREARAVRLELKTACERKDGARDAATLFEFARARLKPKDLWWRLTHGGAIAHDDLLTHVKRHHLGEAHAPRRTAPRCEVARARAHSGHRCRA
jgi:hypothetical protein